jgi:hypothetical protein
MEPAKKKLRDATAGELVYEPTAVLAAMAEGRIACTPASAALARAELAARGH